jgi:2-polyprenyl-6-hydroxyphenyl methylase / 3-demethylubiquinone-9 3-methyltransferase
MNIKKIIKQDKEPFYNVEKNPKEFIKEYNSKYRTLYYRKKLQEVLKLINFSLKEKKVLDIGCCGGYLSLILSKKGAIVTGIDSSKYAIDAANYNAKINKIDNCQFINEDFNKIDLSEKYDLIIAKDVIEHIQEDEKFLEKINSLLKNGGKIIITTQNSFSFNYIFEGIIRKIMGQKKWLGWDSTHIRWYNFLKLKKKFKCANLEIERYSGSYFFPYQIIKLLTKKEPRNKFYTLIDDYLGNKKPFNIMGWSISAIGEKINV